MHASSLENMSRCFAKYLAGDTRSDEQVVLDIGGADVNGGYRPLFNDPKYRYLTVDLEAGNGVDIVLDDPYRLPLDDASVDVVLSGQMLECCEFFWRTFAEMIRVLKPDGYLFLIAPSAGPIHSYPVDCYRFYPDAYRALARHVGCHLLDVWMDERGPWRDLVGVFSRNPNAVPAGPVRARDLPAPTEVTPGTAQEEATSGRGHYRELLGKLHSELEPSSYLEIGVRTGASLALARAPAIGVDPQPALEVTLPPSTQVVEMPSDEYFHQLKEAGRSVRHDLTFIDGMHLFEYVLRDFMNVERLSGFGSLVVIDDVFPSHPAQAERTRRTRVWTGDVWKLYKYLAQYRPDLILVPVDTFPTGLLLIAGLDPANRVLWDRYNPIVRKGCEEQSPPEEILERRGALAPDDPRIGAMLQVLRQSREERAPRDVVVDRLRAALKPKVARASVPRISIVVIAYNMARELPRTLQSLSPTCQKGVGADDYEVILIDNGSTVPFDHELCRRLCPNVDIHVVSDASPSPVAAINMGLDLARGDLIGVMIDGARMASPGLIATAIEASRLHERPVIGTLAFHLGPDVQSRSHAKGYDQKVEDALLDSIDWVGDGYNLYSISVFGGSSARGWFAPPSETSALFLRRRQWEELGGYDPAFQSPGGGLVNLDTWSRACAMPDSQMMLLLGEATFHQTHGGVATGASSSRWREFHDEYVSIRGTRYSAPVGTPLMVGRLPPQAHSSVQASLSDVGKK